MHFYLLVDDQIHQLYHRITMFIESEKAAAPTDGDIEIAQGDLCLTRGYQCTYTRKEFFDLFQPYQFDSTITNTPREEVSVFDLGCFRWPLTIGSQSDTPDMVVPITNQTVSTDAPCVTTISKFADQRSRTQDPEYAPEDTDSFSSVFSEKVPCGPESTETVFYYRVEKESPALGPVSLCDLKDYLSMGFIPSSTQVWRKDTARKTYDLESTLALFSQGKGLYFEPSRAVSSSITLPHHVESAKSFAQALAIKPNSVNEDSQGLKVQDNRKDNFVNILGDSNRDVAKEDLHADAQVDEVEEVVYICGTEVENMNNKCEDPNTSMNTMESCSESTTNLPSVVDSHPSKNLENLKGQRQSKLPSARPHREAKKAISFPSPKAARAQGQKHSDNKPISTNKDTSYSTAVEDLDKLAKLPLDAAIPPAPTETPWNRTVKPIIGSQVPSHINSNSPVHHSGNSTRVGNVWLQRMKKHQGKESTGDHIENTNFGDSHDDSRKEVKTLNRPENESTNSSKSSSNINSRKGHRVKGRTVKNLLNVKLRDSHNLD